METQLTETSGTQKEAWTSQITFPMTFYDGIAACCTHSEMAYLPWAQGVPSSSLSRMIQDLHGTDSPVSSRNFRVSHYAYRHVSQNPTLLFLSLRLKNTHVCTKPFWQMQMPLRHQRTGKHTWKLGCAQPAQWNHLWAQLLSCYLYPSWAQLSYRQIRMNNIQQSEVGQTVLPCREGLQSYPVWCKHII